MPALSKTCPQCFTNVNVKRSVCDCRHCFVLKHKVFVDACRKSQRLAKRSKRALETTAETISRQNRANMAQKRALESPNDTLCRQEQNRVRMSKKSALENPSEAICRREKN